MPLSLIVFDDFYGDPMEIRRAALSLLYPPVSDANYPGRNSNHELRPPASRISATPAMPSSSATAPTHRNGSTS
jgi:hypothetical protein